LSLVLALQSAAGVAVRREGDRLVMTRRVMFVRGHVEHVAASKAVVDAMAGYLRRQADVEIVIEGHSDIGGDEAENVRLSLARAEFVVQGLRRRGVTVPIRAVGRGSSEPLVAANHPELWRNRRIEVRVVAVSSTAPVVATLDDETVPLRVDEGKRRTAPPAVQPPAIALLDDNVTREPAAPALRLPGGPRVVRLDDSPHLALTDDDDLLPVSFATMPHIALLDDEPHIGLVE
jgi:hypothetical protein